MLFYLFGWPPSPHLPSCEYASLSIVLRFSLAYYFAFSVACTLKLCRYSVMLSPPLFSFCPVVVLFNRFWFDLLRVVVCLGMRSPRIRFQLVPVPFAMCVPGAYPTLISLFLLSLSNCLVLLFSVTRKGKLTGRTGRPASCRVDIWTLPVPLLYLSSFPSQNGWREPKHIQPRMWPRLPMVPTIDVLHFEVISGLLCLAPRRPLPRLSWNCVVYLC